MATILDAAVSSNAQLGGVLERRKIRRWSLDANFPQLRNGLDVSEARMGLQRYLTEDGFCDELKKLRVYPGFVGIGLLEQLERAKLLTPILRRQLPETIARRLWLESHSEFVSQMHGAIEPDGSRWNAACALLNAEHKWAHARAHGASAHPFDDPAEEFLEFLARPAEAEFVPWNELRVDVSNDAYPKLFDSTYVRSFYSSWQLLLAAEVANAGVIFRVNLADDAEWSSTRTALDEGRIPSAWYSYSFLPIDAIRAFAKHQGTLDAVVWYSEECDRNLSELLRNQPGGRFRLTPQQTEREEKAREQLAEEVERREHVSSDDLVALCKYLAEQWAQWDGDRRPAVADAYRSVLWNAVQLLKLVGRLSFDEIRDLVGSAGGWREPILDKVWPNWVAQEKQRVLRTLVNAPSPFENAALLPEIVESFVDFLSTNGLEAFFWRLQSFEKHAFGSSEYAVEGMKADLQGLALCVEHMASALGATDVQLYDKFKRLWKDPAVLSILKRGDVAPLARQARLSNDWPALKAKIDALRSEPGGGVAADLVLAHRIRGGVHHLLPEDDQFELEFQFVTLMRAAALTFAEVQRSRAVQATSGP